jgi:hypothetical protein
MNTTITIFAVRDIRFSLSTVVYDMNKIYLHLLLMVAEDMNPDIGENEE